jgi:DNA-binding NtrC family response regulator
MSSSLLIAEGDTELCEFYQMFLRKRGYEVETASDGLDCLKKLRQLQPAVLVLDLELRWGGGDGVVACMRQEHVQPTVPVILTATAGSPPPVAEPPVVKFLPKPFPMTTLLDSVRAAIAQKGREELCGMDQVECSELFIG